MVFRLSISLVIFYHHFLKLDSHILCFITIKENICGLQTINTIYNKKYITSFSSWCDDKGMHKCWLKIDFPSSVCWDVCTPLYTICWIFTSYITMMFINNVWNNKYAITLFYLIKDRCTLNKYSAFIWKNRLYLYRSISIIISYIYNYACMVDVCK